MHGTIDILMAAYNGEPYIEEQIDSIFSQTYPDWKLTIRDDGSTDKTLSIINTYVKQYPQKIFLIEDSLGRLGAPHNFMRLLEQAESPYMMFCDQDDIWLADKLECSLKEIQKLEAQFPGLPVLIHTDLKIIDASGTTTSDSFWAYKQIDPNTTNILTALLHHNVVTGCTAMLNRKAKEMSLPMPPECRIHDWWIALTVARHGKILALPAPTVLYRQHETNVIGAGRSKIRWCEWPGRFFKLLRQSNNNYRCVKQILPDISFIPWYLKELSTQFRRRFRRS